MRRVLGLRDLLLIAAAGMGPAFSLASTYGPMVATSGSATPLALLAIFAIMACIAVGYRRMGQRYPNAGSSYTWVAIAFGPVAGAYAAWILIVANIFAMVATSAPAGAYTLALLGVAASPLANAAVGSLWVLGAGVLMWRGLAPTSRVANGLAIAELVVLLAAAGAAIVRAPIAQAASTAPLPNAGGFAAALVLGIWMIDGWEVSASTAEEARAGDRAPGMGGLLGLIVTVAVLYACMTAFGRVGTIAGYGEHAADSLAYVGANLGGAWRAALSATVLVSLTAAIQATVVYLSRSVFAMGRDGALPAALGRLDARGQPIVAVVSLTAIGIAGTMASGLSASVRDAFAFILNGTAVFLGVLFVISAAAGVRLFWGERAGRWSGVVVPGAGLIALAAVIVASLVQDDPGTRAFVLSAAVAGLPLALWRGRHLRVAAPSSESTGAQQG